MDLHLDWLTSPHKVLAYRAADLTGDLRSLVVREVLTQIAGVNGLTDEAFGEMLEELQSSPEFLAKVESETVRRAAQVRDVAELSVEQQAVASATSGLHGYHPQGFGSAEAMLEDALQHTKYHSTEWYNLRTLLRVILPYCRQHGIEVSERLWDDDFKSKARYLADFLGPRLKPGAGAVADGMAAAALVDQTAAFVADVVDPDISVSKLKERYPPTPVSGVAPLEVIHYVEPEGGVLVIPYATEAQRLTVQRALGKQTQWRLGDGREPVLARLVRSPKSRDGRSD